MSTDCTLLQWFQRVEDLARDLATATGTPVSDEMKKTVILDGLLPEFKTKKLMIQDKGNGHDLQRTKEDLQDFAQEEGILELKKSSSQKRNQSYALDGLRKRKGSPPTKNLPSKRLQTHRAKLATQPCKNWAEGVCNYGDKCYRKHEGPAGAGAALKGTPTSKAMSAAPSSSLPVPSAPRAVCQYCSIDGHVIRECPQYLQAIKENSSALMFANAHVDPAYTFSLVEEELPEDEAPAIVNHDHQSTITPMKTLFSLFSLVIFYLSGAFTEVRRILKSLAIWSIDWRTFLFFLVIAALMSYSFAATTPFVRTASYYNDDAGVDERVDLQWVADTGTNRFVTNEIEDFIPGTVVYNKTKVAVGGGETISPCSGSVLVFSLDHDVTIRCDEVILLPQCARKLMPAHQFTKKGCILEFSEGVRLLTKDGVPILSGPQIGGLFYFRSKTLQSTMPPVKNDSVLNAASLFGLPASQSIINAGADLPKRLLEAHWSYGHLEFSSLRKLLGLGTLNAQSALWRNRNKQRSLMRRRGFDRADLVTGCIWM